MESFNLRLKKEIASLKVDSQRLALSRLSGIVKSSGEIQKNSNGISLVVRTELLPLFDAINYLLDILYNTSAELVIADEVGYKDKPKYEIHFPSNLAKQILLDTEVAFLDEEKNFCINSGISKYVIENKEECIEYLKGVFLVAGTSNVVISNEIKKLNKNSGYQLEFVFFENQLASDFALLLADLDIITKTIERRENNVVYVQDFSQVSSLIGLMGATKSFLELQNENAYREVRSNINRQNNCISGNITKVVNASVEQLEDIKYIQNTIGLENLELPLQNVCYLRLANPEESLDNLVKLSTEKLTKSGLYHRFQKIKKIVKDLK